VTITHTEIIRSLMIRIESYFLFSKTLNNWIIQLKKITPCVTLRLTVHCFEKKKRWIFDKSMMSILMIGNDTLRRWDIIRILPRSYQFKNFMRSTTSREISQNKMIRSAGLCRTRAYTNRMCGMQCMLCCYVVDALSGARLWIKSVRNYSACWHVGFI